MTADEIVSRLRAIPADFEKFTKLALEMQPDKIVLLQNMVLERENKELREQLDKVNGHEDIPLKETVEG
tara:strand:+ start:271 stop:477 length:207 start_codon:yes stop_codon:yes gene_type:complete